MSRESSVSHSFLGKHMSISQHCHKGSETVEQVAQKSFKCPTFAGIQGQIEEGPEEPGLVDNVPALGRVRSVPW